MPSPPYESDDPVGGGRGRKKKCPRFVDALEDLLRDTIAGDPMTGLKWTHKSIRKLCDALRKQRLPCGHGAVARVLHDQKFSLRTNRKRLARTHDPQRDRQFCYLAFMRRWYVC